MLGISATKESNDTNDTLELDALEALGQGAASADFDDVIHAGVVGGKFPGCLAPVGIRLVVNDMIGAEFLQLLGLLRRRGRSDDGRASSFGELEVTSLVLAELDRAALKKTIPVDRRY